MDHRLYPDKNKLTECSFIQEKQSEEIFWQDQYNKYNSCIINRVTEKLC